MVLRSTFILSLFTLVSAPQLNAQGPFVDIVEKAVYVVSIKAFDNLRSLGSGIYFKQDGRNLIMTVSHIIRMVSYTLDEFRTIKDSVVSYRNIILVHFNDGSRRPFVAHLRLHNPGGDIAIFELTDTNLTNLPEPAKWGDSDKLKQGEIVVIVSTAIEGADVQFDMDDGSIARTEVRGTGDLEGYPRLIEINARTDPGSSGGATISPRNNKVIGLIVGGNSISTPSGIAYIEPSYAIPVNDALKTLSELDPDGKFVRVTQGALSDSLGQVGFITCMYSPPIQDCEYGSVVVARVPPGTEAERNGLKVGDVVRAIDDEVVENMFDLRVILALDHKPEQVITLTVWRPSINREIDIPLTLGTWKTQRGS